MGKAKWWVCDSCVSLNDVPANKCYNCRESKPADPKLIDDNYAEVGGQKRVGITVDLSQVGDLTRPDPVESSKGGALMEAFDKTDDPYADLEAKQSADAQQAGTPRYDPYAGGMESGDQQPSAKPAMREPAQRGIDAIGGRHWTEEPEPPETATEAPAGEATDAGQPAAPPPPPPAAPPPPGAAPPGALPPPPPGAMPPPPPGAIPPPPPGAVPRPPVPPPPPGAPRPPGAPPPPPPGVMGRPPGAPPPPPQAPPRPPGPPPKPPTGE